MVKSFGFISAIWTGTAATLLPKGHIVNRSKLPFNVYNDSISGLKINCEEAHNQGSGARCASRLNAPLQNPSFGASPLNAPLKYVNDEATPSSYFLKNALFEASSINAPFKNPNLGSSPPNVPFEGSNFGVSLFKHASQKSKVWRLASQFTRWKSNFGASTPNTTPELQFSEPHLQPAFKNHRFVSASTSASFENRSQRPTPLSKRLRLRLWQPCAPY